MRGARGNDAQMGSAAAVRAGCTSCCGRVHAGEVLLVARGTAAAAYTAVGELPTQQLELRLHGVISGWQQQ